MEAIQPWINPQMWNEMKKLENARPNMMDSPEIWGNDTRDHGYYVGEDGELHHPLIDAVKNKRAKEAKETKDIPKQHQSSFRPLPS